MPAEQEYVLGTNDAEFRRLGLQHRIWSEQAFDLWERAGFAPGQTLLDVGCGPGYATIDLARLLGPTAKLIAVDASARFIELLRSRIAQENLDNIQTHVLDLAEIDLPAHSIDAAYARWVLCFLPKPAEVVRRIAEALKPGGVLAVQDYFSYH
ncbi:MAG TPA: class I SAM-dependent methyltransferase, partial [Pirellulales bacterium]